MVADAAEGMGYNQSRPRLQRTMKLHSDLHQALEGLQLQTTASPSLLLDPMRSYQVSVQQLQEELQREKDQVSRLVERLERAEQKSEELRQQQEQDAKESWNTVHQEMETNQEMGGMVERMRGKVQEFSTILLRKISWGGWAGMKDEEEEEEERKPANTLNSECVNQCQAMHPDRSTNAGPKEVPKEPRTRTREGSPGPAPLPSDVAVEVAEDAGGTEGYCEEAEDRHEEGDREHAGDGRRPLEQQTEQPGHMPSSSP